MIFSTNELSAMSIDNVDSTHSNLLRLIGLNLIGHTINADRHQSSL
jgi:hypothetical protein